jgi:hypothetical protein
LSRAAIVQKKNFTRRTKERKRDNFTKPKLAGHEVAKESWWRIAKIVTKKLVVPRLFAENRLTDSMFLVDRAISPIFGLQLI